ncbi:LytR cell envelope-related transcriptional attenuator [Eubacterium ruminantium]|nr:LytR cell envelope-related transcriptional attenuator [Eubacterium ruminantium]
MYDDEEYEDNSEYEESVDTEEAVEKKTGRKGSDKPKKRSAAGLFLSGFFRGIVIILAIVILGLSVFLVKEIIDGKKIRDEKGKKVSVDESILTEEKNKKDHLITNTENSDSNTAEATEAPDGLGDDQNLSSSENIKIVVLNATDVAGLAGSWTAKLTDAGYTDVSAANSFMQYDDTRILVAENGMGTDLLKFFPNASISVGNMTNDETDADLDGVKIFIIVGTSDSGQ